MACVYHWNVRFFNYYSLLLKNNPENNKKDESVTGGGYQFLLITINNTEKKALKSIIPVLSRGAYSKTLYHKQGNAKTESQASTILPVATSYAFPTMSNANGASIK